MHPTRRLWAVVALAGVLAALAVAAARPLLLAGAGLIGAWLLMRQYRFLRTLEDAVDGLTVRQTVAREQIRTGTPVPVTLAGSLSTPSSLRLAVEAGLPTGATAAEPLSTTVASGETDADRTVEVAWPTAGRYEFDAPTVTATDGLFRETVSVGDAPAVTVESRGPRDVHVGERGTRITTVYGEHEIGRRGSGLEPAELREYVPGDAANQIDWKATARQASPYVREYEAETDRRTLLVVDHRAPLATGPPHETKLAYLREVALSTAASARRAGDPVGLVTVGDGGVTFRLESGTAPSAHARIRRELLDLEPTLEAGTAGGDGQSDALRAFRSSAPATAAEARGSAAALEGDDDPFATTLRPFYAARDRYQERIDSDPLYAAVGRSLDRGPTASRTFIFTDDSHPAELRETVKRARGNGNSVVVLLAPSVLYEGDALGDLDRAYGRYLEFERLRRELGGMRRVTALEVGPADRLSTLLSTDRTATRGGHA